MGNERGIARRGPNGHGEAPVAEPTHIRVPAISDVAAREVNRVGQFLQDHVLGDRPDGKPIRVALRHVAGGRIGDLIWQEQVDRLTAEEVPEYANAIYQRADSDAQGVGKGKQQYVVLAYLEENPGEPGGRCLFWTSAPDKTNHSDGWMTSDIPTEPGMNAALMAQNRELHNHSIEQVEVMSTLFAAFRDLTTDLMSEVASMRSERREDAKAIDSARESLWKRNREDRELDAKIVRDQGIMELLKGVAPPILRRLGASKGEAPVMSPKEDHMLFLAERIMAHPEKVEKIMSALDETEKFVFYDWLKFHVERTTGKKQDDPAQTVTAQQAAAAQAAARPAAAVTAPVQTTESKE